MLDEQPGKNATDLESGKESEKVEDDNFYVEDCFRLLDRGKTHYIKTDHLKKALTESKLKEEKEIEIPGNKNLFNKDDYKEWVKEQADFRAQDLHDHLYKKNLGFLSCFMYCCCSIDSQKKQRRENSGERALQRHNRKDVVLVTHNL